MVISGYLTILVWIILVNKHTSVPILPPLCPPQWFGDRRSGGRRKGKRGEEGDLKTLLFIQRPCFLRFWSLFGLIVIRIFRKYTYFLSKKIHCFVSCSLYIFWVMKIRTRLQALMLWINLFLKKVSSLWNAWGKILYFAKKLRKVMFFRSRC